MDLYAAVRDGSHRLAAATRLDDDERHNVGGKVDWLSTGRTLRRCVKQAHDYPLNAVMRKRQARGLNLDPR